MKGMMVNKYSKLILHHLSSFPLTLLAILKNEWHWHHVPTLTLSLPTLPFELIVEILSRLPVKSLMQFQCVCKSWKSLISDPKFAKKHLCTSTKDDQLISFFDTSILMSYHLSSIITEVISMELEYPLTILHRRFHPIIGSCHGILCIQMDRVSVILWNPSIKKFIKLPALEESLNETLHSAYHYEFSFGYDHSSDSYKVVASFCNVSVININVNRVKEFPVKVHTLGTNSWRTIQDFPSGSGFVCEDLSGKFVCGTINWLTFKHPTSSWNIVSLDLEKESYVEIVQPDYGITLASLKLGLGVLRDCLCIFSRSRSDTFTDIWFMKEYGNKESWIKLFRVPDVRDFGYDPYVCAHYVFEDDQLLLDIESELVVYNSKDGTFKYLNIESIGWRGTQVYHESLISPCF